MGFVNRKQQQILNTIADRFPDENEDYPLEGVIEHCQKETGRKPDDIEHTIHLLVSKKMLDLETSHHQTFIRLTMRGAIEAEPV